MLLTCRFELGVAKRKKLDHQVLRTFFKSEKRNISMLKRLKQYFFIGLAIAVVYFLLSQHIIIHGKNFFFLKKQEMTLEYTFFSIQEKKAAYIMQIAPLRKAGIGNILVELQIITDEERYKLENYYEYN
jgi:hypothetical protein